jgi:hypothetical protein
MSKTTVALGSLIVGATLGFFCGNRTSMVVQRALAQPNPPSGNFISSPTAVPVVPGIRAHATNSHGYGKTQQLDGMDFTNSEFGDMTWEYSGGAFSLVSVKISAPMRVTLKGAAANTMALLAIVQAVNTGAHPEPMNPNAPILRQTTEKHTVIVDLTSPYKGFDKDSPQR